MNYLGVGGSKAACRERIIIWNETDLYCILPVFSEVGYDIADPHDTAFKCTWDLFFICRRICVAVLNRSVKFSPWIVSVKCLRCIALLFHFTVVTYNTIKHLEADISEYKFVKYSGAMDVVVEESSGMLVVDLIQITLSGMTKWSMSDVMSKGDCLYEIKIESKSHSDSPCNSGYKLDVKCTS